MSLPPKIPGAFEKGVLSASEYVAQNAFVAPGFHRLFTAGGLAFGLWGGRRVMDVVTAKRSDGSELAFEQTPVLLRPLYGKMRYRQYSDTPADRWKFVADRLIPIAFGALGAWSGSAYYAYGRNFRGNPFHQASAGILKQYEENHMSLQVADSMFRIKQADSIRYPASGLFGLGAAAGTHLPGAISPFSNGSWSSHVFKLHNEKNINFFGLRYLNKHLFGNISYGSNTLRPAMADAARWMEANLMKFGDPRIWVEDRALRRRATDALQNFRQVTPEMENKVMQGMRDLLDSAHHKAQELRLAGKSEAEISEAVHAHLTGQRAPMPGENPLHHFGLLGSAFDNLLHHYGIPLEQAHLGESKGLSFLARLFGSTSHEVKVEQKLAAHLKQAYGIDYGPSKIRVTPWKRAATWAGLAAGGSAVITTGGVIGRHINKRVSRTYDDEHTHMFDPAAVLEHSKAADAAEDTRRQSSREHKRAHGFAHWLNGTPLDVMQWGARVTVTPPSMHRLMSAAFLSATLYSGMKFANVLAGRDLKLLNSKAIPTSLIEKERTWKILQPLHGKLSYTPGSNALADRWRQALHYLIPVSIGAVGTYTGSATFFHDRTRKLARPESLEDYTDRISLEQSKVFGALTAVTSIFNTGSGLHMAPFINYSSNMHNRYLMGNGQQVAFPGLGKWWSGNAGLTPWGVKRTLSYMTKYLAYNPAPRPRELSSLVHSVLGKLYPDLDYDTLLAKKQAVLNRIYEVRDSYLVDGHIPDDKQDALYEAMNRLLTGKGFEYVLEMAGLNPAQANLAANGASGRIANVLGKGQKVKALQNEYREKFTERLSRQGTVAAADYLHALADRSVGHVAALSGDSANDNRTSFAERIRQEPKATSKISA